MSRIRNWLIQLYYDKYSNDKNKLLNLIILVVMKLTTNKPSKTI